MAESHSCFLQADSLVSGYGKKQVLNGVNVEVATGEVVAVIGHNGAGKSTLLKAIFGLLPMWQGRVVVDGKLVSKPNPRELLRSGVAYVAQGNRVFADLTVRENLKMGGVTLTDKAVFTAGIARVLDLFPDLERHLSQRAGTLSGGEKQMLALGSALLLSPRLLLLDEPSLGLAPALVSRALVCIRQISEVSGAAVLIVEQKVREVLNIAQRVYVLRNGIVSFSGAAAELKDEHRLREVYL